jgi:hypothetical protein
MSQGVRSAPEIPSAIASAISVPRAIVAGVPPVAWMAIISVGFPARRPASASSCAMICSHPSATTSTAPTFGCPQYASSVSCVMPRSGPI